MYCPIPEESEFWRNNRLLWAVEQVLAKQREKNQAKLRRAWQRRMQQAIASRVLQYPWEQYWRRIAKQEEELPPELLAAFDVVVQMIPKLWEEAGKTAIAQSMVRGFDEVYAWSVFQQGVEGTMHLIAGIPDTLKERLRRLLGEAMLEGESSWDFAKLIRRNWLEVSKERAEIIAWTEWGRAVETMNYATAVAGGAVYKVWITVGDARVCPICRANAAQGVLEINQPFAGGVLHPIQHPRCRCTVSYFKSAEVPKL